MGALKFGARGMTVFLMLHLAFYAFTGIALWGPAEMSFGRVYALFMLHMVSFFVLLHWFIEG